MSVLFKHHIPKCGIAGKCSVPMWMGGTPHGFCDREAYGEQYTGRHTPPQYMGCYGRPKPFATGYCCDWHGGPSATGIRFVRDGDMWCAFRPDFENLAESPAGFGTSQDKAEDDLIDAEMREKAA